MASARRMASLRTVNRCCPWPGMKDARSENGPDADPDGGRPGDFASLTASPMSQNGQEGGTGGVYWSGPTDYKAEDDCLIGQNQRSSLPKVRRQQHWMRPVVTDAS